MQAPVTTLDKNKAFFLDLSDVTFIRLGENEYSRDLMFGTPANTFRLVRPVQEMADALEGTSFMRVFQHIIVNMDRANDYDDKRGIVYFEPSGVEQLNWAYVSRENRKKVKSWLG